MAARTTQCVDLSLRLDVVSAYDWKKLNKNNFRWELVTCMVYSKVLYNHQKEDPLIQTILYSFFIRLELILLPTGI